jgi:beta-lactam-binding protein with PASTA domain
VSLTVQKPVVQSWLALKEEPERVIPIAGTVQYTVAIVAPPDADPGSYSFNLDVLGEENPDEDYTRGPAVTFEVPAPVVVKKRPFPWWILAVVAAVLLVVSLAAFFLWPRSVEVPDVAGLGFAAAVASLEEAGLEVEEETVQEANATVPSGSVVRTEPPKGESVGRGESVTLVISTGPGVVKVPALSGKTKEEATQLLAEKSLKVRGTTEEASATLAAGLVIRSVPPEGQDAPTGSSVDLVLSSGPATVPVPPLTGLNTAEADAALTGVGLQLGMRRGEPSDRFANGIVIRSDPLAGTQVTLGTTVDIIVARNPTELGAPVQTSPADGAVFSNFPRTTTVQWQAVSGAASYTMEWAFLSPGQTCAAADTTGGRSGPIPNIAGTSHTFTFVGAQPGCWRVWAVDADGKEGAKSPWRGFRYTV